MKDFFKRVFQKIQYWFWRIVDMSCEEKVKKILNDMGAGKLLDDPKHSKKIKDLCGKMEMSEYAIAQEIIKDYLLDEMSKDLSLSFEQRNQIINEIRGGNYLNQENKEVNDNSENKGPSRRCKM